MKAPLPRRRATPGANGATRRDTRRPAPPAARLSANAPTAARPRRRKSPPAPPVTGSNIPTTEARVTARSAASSSATTARLLKSMKGTVSSDSSSRSSTSSSTSSTGSITIPDDRVKIGVEERRPLNAFFCVGQARFAALRSFTLPVLYAARRKDLTFCPVSVIIGL